MIYEACVRDNRKVKGYSRGLKGGGEMEAKTDRESEPVVKERSREGEREEEKEESYLFAMALLIRYNGVCSWKLAIRMLSLMETILLVCLYCVWARGGLSTYDTK